MIEFYWDNKNLQYRGFSINGKREGPFSAYYNSGKKWYVSNFKDGKLNGEKITFGETGDTLSIEEYENGVKVE